MPAAKHPGSPIVTKYVYATGQYMRPQFYTATRDPSARREGYDGLSTALDNKNTRMNQPGYSPIQNYMVGPGNQPMDRGGPNLMPSPIQGFEYLTSSDFIPPTATPQNGNIYPPMYNRQGLREDPQAFQAGLVKALPMEQDNKLKGVENIE